MSHIRKRATRIHQKLGTAGLIVSVIALVLALTGAAFAAAGLNSKQKKEVTAIAKKYAGKPGAPGATGPAGPAGTNGTNGTNGEKGPQGEKGEKGDPGTNGTNGANATFEYLFNTATTGDPTSKKLLLNNATPGSATSVNISKTDNEGASGTNIAAAIAKWNSGPGDLGTLMIRKVSTQSTYAEYSIKANKDEGAYDSVEVVFIAGNGSFANSDPVTVQYYATASETLPSGKTETGSWGGTIVANSLAHGEVFSPISFNIPLAVTLDAAHTKFNGDAEFEGATHSSTTVTNVTNFGGGILVGDRITGTHIPAGTTITAYNETTKEVTLSQAATTTNANEEFTEPVFAECENAGHAGAASAANPEAGSGYLCVYVFAGEFGVGQITKNGVFALGASPSGALVKAEKKTVGGAVYGSWAVTG